MMFLNLLHSHKLIAKQRHTLETEIYVAVDFIKQQSFAVLSYFQYEASMKLLQEKKRKTLTKK